MLWHGVKKGGKELFTFFCIGPKSAKWVLGKHRRAIDMRGIEIASQMRLLWREISTKLVKA